MKSKIISFIYLIIVSNQLQAQKTIKVEGSCKIRIETNISFDQAKKEVLACAQKKALEDAFGTKIIQTDIIKSQSKTESAKITSSSTYNSIGNIEVNGEWLETSGEPVFKKIAGANGEDFIECTVSGRARPLKKIAINFESYPITNDGNKESKSLTFNNNQNLYFYFKAAKNGYLSIYLDDTKNAYQLLPYKSSQVENYEVSLDKEYYFFSNKSAKLFPDKVNTGVKIDELILNTDEAVEQNILYILFSTKKFDKPLLNNDNTTLSEEDKKGGYQLPKFTSSQKFIAYLQELRKIHEEMEILPIAISINGK